MTENHQAKEELWWDAFSHIAAYALPIIEDFCEKRDGSVPGVLIEAHNEDADLAAREWDAILNDIRLALRYVVNDDELELNVEQRRHRDQGLELFGKWFMHLWD
jgi:hypothetical protein